MSNYLFVTEFYFPHVGGAESLFKNIAEELVKRGNKVRFVTSSIKGSPKHEVINGVEVYRVTVPKIGSRYFFTFLALPKTLRFASKSDLIQTTTYNAAFPASLAGLLCRKPVVIIVHEVWGKLWFRMPGISLFSKILLYYFELLLLSLPFSKFICVSKSTKNDLANLKPKANKKSVVVYNGIDYENLIPKPKVHKADQPKQTVLFFGRPGISKGVENLVEAINNTKNKNLIFRIILSKDESKRFNLIKNSIKNPRVVLEPSLPKPELINSIAESSYVIIPSLAEGFGYAALEASIYAQKIICSDQKSLKEVAFGQVKFYNPWSEHELVNIFNDISHIKFDQVKEKRFPIQQTVNEYLSIYKEYER